MKKIFLGFALVVAALFLYSCKSAQQTTAGKTLKFNFEKGKGYAYDMVWDMDTKVAGQSTQMSIDGSYTMQITEDDGAIKTVATSYKSLKMNMDVAGMHLEMDSNKPGTGSLETDPMGALGKVFASLVNKPFTIKVNAEGQVLEVSGFEKIVDDMIDSMPVNESAKSQIKASMKDQFNEQSLKDNFAQVFTIFPNKEIKVGDTWEKTYTTGGKTPAKFTTKYTAKEIDGDHVSLATSTKITPTGGETEVNGEQTGNILVDSKTGLMINAAFDQDMNIKVQGTEVKLVGKGKIKGTAL